MAVISTVPCSCKVIPASGFSSDRSQLMYALDTVPWSATGYLRIQVPY